MPVISMFYGIIISMYFLDTKQHNFPHIHVSFQESEAVIRIPDGELIDGEIPRSKLKLVEAWVEIHKDELMANWKLASSGENVFKIDPLK